MAVPRLAGHGSRRHGRLKQYLPILRWLPEYQQTWFRADFLAGLALWAVLVPTSMAYAGIADVPPLVGLYTVPLPLIAYAIFGSSRTMVIGPDSATALLSGVTVGAVVSQGSSDFLVLTSALAMAVGGSFWSSACSAWDGWPTSFPSPR